MYHLTPTRINRRDILGPLMFKSWLRPAVGVGYLVKWAYFAPTPLLELGLLRALNFLTAFSEKR
jgi:hypothetical protein